jgi:hypothetical protein
MNPWSALATASGLSLASGLRAYLPLLALGLAARNTHLVTLHPPYTALTQTRVLLLAILSLLELGADKVPLLNHANDAVHTVLRPLSGAVAFAGTSNALSASHPTLAFVVGLLLALTVHTTRAAAIRPAVTVSTLGIGTPVVSAVEDVLAAGLSAVALLAPLLAAMPPPGSGLPGG